MARASLVLKLDDGLGHSIQVTDGGLKDACAEANCVTYSGALGGWNINVSTGVSKDASAPTLLDLNTYNHHNAGTNSTLKLSLSDNFFTTFGSGMQLSVGGTLGSGGRMTVAAYGGSSNTLFDTSHQLGSTLTFSSGPYTSVVDGITAGLRGPADPYSLTILTTLTFGTVAGAGSSDAAIDAVPEPASVALTGTLLLGMTAVLRKRFRNA
jgi:hypothetical protein